MMVRKAERWCVYLITSKINGRQYVGKGTLDVLRSGIERVKRWRDHKRASNDSTVSNAIKKHGVENFMFEIVERFTDEDRAYEREVELIAELGTLVPNGYNENGGGKGTRNIQPSTCEKISIALTGRKLAPEHCRNISRAQTGVSRGKGRVSPLRGKKMTPEQVERNRATQKAVAQRPGYVNSQLGKRGPEASKHGWKTPDDVKAKQRASNRRYWAKRRTAELIPAMLAGIKMKFVKI